MSRRIRRVPKDWQHPTDENGRYLPIEDQTYPGAIVDHLRRLLWYLLRPQYIGDWLEGFPDKAYCRPHFRKGAAVCYQVYEEVSEGTPISPIFESLTELKTWLLKRGYSRHATVMFIDRGWAPSALIMDGVSKTGVHSLDWLPADGYQRPYQNN